MEPLRRAWSWQAKLTAPVRWIQNDGDLSSGRSWLWKRNTLWACPTTAWRYFRIFFNFSGRFLGQNWSKKTPKGRGSYLTKYGPTIYFLDPDHAPNTFGHPRKSQEKSHFCFFAESQIIKVGWWGVGSRAWLPLLKVSAHHHF